ncbi:MAG: co-chaperone DjlA [Gammaproteobacteria bacterium]|nr:co-chaperone DjlA [Gammaproteobacteria bacterium]
MSWWGTIIGGALGFMLGGPLGALLGASMASNFSVNTNTGQQQGNFSAGDTERVQAAFFSATFAVMGHIAKADGVVSQDEINNAKNIMAQMNLGPQQRKTAMHLFNEGKKDNFPLHEVVTQFRKECHRRRNLIQMFLEIQIMMVLADGKIDPAEKNIMFSIGEQLGFHQAQIEQLLHSASGVQQNASPKVQLKEAYEMLGIPESSSDQEVKKAYRRLMSQHHPDKLVSKGLPEEMIKIATEKTQKIRKAYDFVRESRK